MTQDKISKLEQLPFKVHPRAFAALGADLVTNDVVAVIELVKNSYDAFATEVWVRFGHDEDGTEYLEVADNGCGMTHDIIEHVWCLVATPFKTENEYVYSTVNNKKRRVAGEKGLGRLSAARLGQQLQMVTRAKDNPCWEVVVDWGQLSSQDELASCFVECFESANPNLIEDGKTGTTLRITGLDEPWDDHKILDLNENLSRIMSPFEEDLGEFSVYLETPVSSVMDDILVEPPTFLKKPKYAIEGSVDSDGRLSGTYRYRPVDGGLGREVKLERSWGQVYSALEEGERVNLAPKKVICGPFSFEIRVWDIAPQDTQEISEHFKLAKSSIRKAIRTHKGVSVYRDGILALPKSDAARDWLGLDLRRVSKVGTRLSTSQIVGCVSISAENNPGLKDTSDRERLMGSRELEEFMRILLAAVKLLENERDLDRREPEKEKPLKDLFEGLSAESLLADVVALAEEGSSADEALPVLRAFSEKLDRIRETIRTRMVYYSRMATVGTIAQMLVHEIRNRTTAFGSFLSFIRERFSPLDPDVEQEYESAVGGVDALERLSDTFLPLASRSFKRRRLNSCLQERINECLGYHRGEIRKKKISYSVPSGETRVAVDPGELDAILLNVITNAIYWLGQNKEVPRELRFSMRKISNGSRVRVKVSDTGPGIEEEYLEKVFWPGVTRKPGGIGMGLTVASELVAEYGGRMAVESGDGVDGATFQFDLPAKTKG